VSIAFVSGTIKDLVASTAFTLTKPASVVGGNLLVCTLGMGTSGLTIATVPATWTIITAFKTTAIPSMAAYYHVTNTSEPTTYEWKTISDVSNCIGAIVQYSGVTTTNPINANGWHAVVTSATANFPSVTTTAATCKLIMAGFNHTGAPTWSTPPTTTKRETASSTNSMYVFDITAGAAGATTARTSTLSVSEAWRTVTIALKPEIISITQPRQPNLRSAAIIRSSIW
jgi:hypothetical protein